MGYDGSANANRALKKAIELTKEFKNEMMVVVAVNATKTVAATGPHMFSQPGRDYVDSILAQGRDLLSEALKQTRLAGLEDVQGSVEDGPAAGMILSLAERQKADLIIVGRRGVTGIKRFLIGSVSSSVVANSLCDVLVVK